MEAKIFFDTWTSFVEANWSRLDALWRDDKLWTAATIGAPRSEGIGSAFGQYMIDKCEGVSRYWKEDRNIDLALAGSGNFSIERFPDGVDPMASHFYPACNEVLVEHEAAGSISWEEMVKLVHLRAKLKVLITYTWDRESDEEPRPGASDDLIGHVRKMFRTLIRQASDSLPENPWTRYLLIIGQRHGSEVHWYGWELSNTGNEERTFSANTPNSG